MPKDEPKRVFKSFDEFRQCYFPKQYEQERGKSRVDQILGQAKNGKKLAKAMN